MGRRITGGIDANPRGGRLQVVAPITARRRKRATRVAAGVVSALLAIATIATGGTAALAVTNPPTGRLYADQTFYAYVGAGETLDVSFQQSAASSLPVEISVLDPTGLAAVSCVVPGSSANGVTCAETDLTSATAGVWTITYAPGNLNSRYFFDIVVRNAADAAITGRVWTTRYEQYQSGAATQSYWVATREGYLYGLRLVNYGAVGSAVRANGFGLVQAGTCTPIYESAEGTSFGANGVFLDPSIEYSENCGDDYLLFFEAPDSALPAQAPSASGPMWIRPAVVPPSSSNLRLTESGPLTRAGDLEFDLTGVNGGYTVQLDVNADGDYTDPVDRIIPWGSPPGAVSIPFDGLDGLGNAIGVCQPMNAQVVVDRVGEMHFVLEDAEQLGNGAATAAGVQLTGLTPGVVAPNPRLYWDDTTLTTVGRQPGEPFDGPDGTNGLDTTTLPAGDGAHGWRSGWGDMRSIENWTYYQANAGAVAAIAAPCAPSLTLDKQATLNDGNANGIADAGETIQYTFLVTNTGNTVLTAVSIDDPRVTGVLPATADIAIGGSQLFTAAPYLVTQEDIAAGQIDNTATASGLDPNAVVVESLPDNTTIPTATTPSPSPSPSPSQAPAGQMASTGSDLSGILTMAALVLLMGALALVVARLTRRPQRE